MKAPMQVGPGHNRGAKKYCWHLAIAVMIGGGLYGGGLRIESEAQPRFAPPMQLAVEREVSGLAAQDLTGEAVKLHNGQVIEQTFTAKGVDSYVVDLPDNHYLAVAVEQQGVDVILRILDPQGKVVLTANRALNKYGTERLYFINEKVGPHRLVVTRYINKEDANDGLKEQYRLTVEALRKATAEDEALLEAEDLELEAQDLARGERYLAARKLWEQVLLVQEKALGKQHPAIAAVLDEIGYTYYIQKDYAPAQRFYERALALREQAWGQEHPELAEVLHNLGTLYYQQKNYAAAAPFYQRALAIREKYWGRAHADTLTVLNNLALLYYQQADFPRAVATYQQVLAAREQQAGADSLELISTLKNIGGVYFQQGDFPRAIPFYMRALRIQEKAEKSPEKLRYPNLSIADTLQPLALGYFQQGEYLAALPFYQRLLALREQEFGPEHLEVAAVLNSIGFIYYQQENYAAATPIYQRSLAIVEKATPPADIAKSSPMASALQSLGFLYYEQGDYATAETYYRRALPLREQLPGTNQTDLVNVLNSLGLLYFQQEEYDLAANFYQRVLQIREQVLGNEHREVATALNNVALVDTEKRDYLAALAHYQRSLAITEKAWGPETAEVASLVTNMGFVNLQQEDYAAAAPLYQRALQIREKLLGPEHADTATAIFNLAFLYYQKQDFSMSLTLNQRSLAIREKLLGPEHIEVANSLYNLGLVYQDTKDYLAAERCYQRSWSIRKALLGNEHPLVVLSTQQLALLYATSQRAADALDWATTAGQLREQGLQRVLISGASSRQRLKYWQQAVAETNTALSLHWQLMPQNPTAANLAFNLLLQRKGRLLDALTTPLSLLRQQLAAADQPLVDQLINRRTQMATLINRGPSKTGLAPHQARLAALTQQLQTVESNLRAKSPLLAPLMTLQLPATVISWEAVQQRLPANTVLIEFVQYRPTLMDLKSTVKSTTMPNASGEATTSTAWSDANKASVMPAARYAAYLLTLTGSPQFVDLGSAAVIDAAIGAWREVVVKEADRALSEINKEVKPASQKLYQLLWLPLQPYLDQSPKNTRLILSPDSALHLLPFEALMNPEGQYLVEQREISYVTSGRDLLLANDQLAKAQAVEGTPRATIFAAADYGSSAGGPVVGGQSFAPIKVATTTTAATIAEGTEVQKILAGTLITGKAATETALRGVARPAILHLALPGYLLTTVVPLPETVAVKEPPAATKESSAVPKTGGLTAKEGSVKEPPSTGSASNLPRSNSLLRTAIFLAGVNARPTATNTATNTAANDGANNTANNLAANIAATRMDGMLNLSEVASLNLLGTTLVVVSQYDPRSGAIISAEGNYYLRRALQAAGSVNQVASLWPQVEKGQRELIMGIYQRLKQGQPINEARRQTQLAMLRQPLRRHPYYWAGLLLSGAVAPAQ